LEETSWGQRRLEAPFEGGQNPEGVVATYMGARIKNTSIYYVST
jgi:hypothetical protein